VNTHVVVYRTGGISNFAWHRSLVLSKDVAEMNQQLIERMGCPCYVVDAARSLSIGLPETFAAGDLLE